MHFTDAEVGLYQRLLCVQWSTGSLPDDDAELQSYGKGNTPVARVKQKFEKGPDGRLRNARMEQERVKQAEFREKQARNGAKGGRPSAKGLGSSGKTQTKAKKSSPSPSPSPSSSPSSDLQPPSPSTPIPPFDRFWLSYPRRTAKAAAERAWKKGKLDSKITEILAAIEKQKAGYEWQKDNGQFIPHPATWLNQARWLDEVKPGFNNGTNQQSSRNSNRPATGAEQRTLGIPESQGDLSEMLRRKRQSGNAVATPTDRT